MFKFKTSLVYMRERRGERGKERDPRQDQGPEDLRMRLCKHHQKGFACALQSLCVGLSEPRLLLLRK